MSYAFGGGSPEHPSYGRILGEDSVRHRGYPTGWPGLKLGFGKAKATGHLTRFEDRPSS